MGLMEEIRTLMAERESHLAAIEAIDLQLHEVRMVMTTRKPRNPNHQGRPDVSSQLVLDALTNHQPQTGKQLRESTGIRKTTLEASLKKLITEGEIVRDPAEWKGPSANYRYARLRSAFMAPAPAVAAVDRIAEASDVGPRAAEDFSL